jgi:hypothetical protein
MRGRPCLRDQGHADAELTAEPQAGDGAVDQQVPIAFCEGAKPSESGEQENGRGQHPHATVIVAEDAEQASSRDGWAVMRVDLPTRFGAEIAAIDGTVMPRLRSAPSHFAQSARAVALTVCPHTQVQVSLSSFTPTFCNVPGPEVIVHLPDTTCSELSVQRASQIMFSSFLGWVTSGPHSN